MISSGCRIAGCLAGIVAVSQAQAQWAVVDAPAIVQLVQQAQTLAQQLQTAREQLTQAQQALQTMTGTRGMELLLSGTSRNYLPTNWPQLSAAVQGSGGFTALAADVRSALGGNAVLSPEQLAVLSPADQQRGVIAGRQSAALRQAVAQEALVNASNRFASIQTLVAAIPAASDQKAILDLQARIGAELGMLQNEQTKLQVLQQALQAQDAVDRQQQREQIIAGHGNFVSRFQPAP